MLDKQKLAYDLALLYAEDVLRNRPRDPKENPITLNYKEVNKLILDAFERGYDYYSGEFGLTEKDV